MRFKIAANKVKVKTLLRQIIWSSSDSGGKIAELQIQTVVALVIQK